MTWWSAHTHSEYSVLDGMAPVTALVNRAADLGQPAVGLTDHGVMSGAFELYKACRARNLAPFPGCELYVTHSLEKEEDRYHLTVLARTTRGYSGLVKLVTQSYRRPAFYRRPRVSFDMLTAFLDEYGEDVVVMTGCFFSMFQQALTWGDEIKARGLVQLLSAKTPHLYIELQHHNTDHADVPDHVTDDWLVDCSFGMAKSLGIPVFATQDCHYLEPEHKDLHTFMKSVSYRAEESEVAFPGDSYHFADGLWVCSHYTDEIWRAAEASASDLVSLNEVELPFLDEYRYRVPSVSQDPDGMLIDLCEQRLTAYGLDTPEYQERLDYELDTIAELGFADYFLLVHDYVDWCRSNDIFVMARGSAGGSLVSYLLGFSQADPIRWKLSFDRFLTPDRVRPPDIDLDIEDTARDKVIQYLAQSHSVTGIGTYLRVGIDENTGRGSLLQMWASSRRKTMGDDRWSMHAYSEVSNVYGLAEVDSNEADRILSLSGKFYRSVGAHAAGFVIEAEDHKLEDWVPTTFIASSETTVTQMTMDDVEDAGFIKLDLLGLRSLTTVRRCLDFLNRTDLGWIPLHDKETIKFIRKGRRNSGIFQLEGFAAAKGCKEIKPRNLADIILINALYRPAAMESGYTETYLARRRGEEQVTYPHPIFEKHLADTLGVPAYQDQVLDIIAELGMPAAERNAFLKAVKVKRGSAGHSETSDRIFRENREKFADLCRAVGMTEADIDWAWELVEGFAAYGFNRAHATVYSMLGYQMAYLRVHHPLEFFAALLETAPKTKRGDYMKEAATAVPLLPVDVNRSLPDWSIDWTSRGIRRGLGDVHGVGAEAAKELVANAPYGSIEDIIANCDARKVTGGKSWEKHRALNGVLLKLQHAGALISVGVHPDD